MVRTLLLFTLMIGIASCASSKKTDMPTASTAVYRKCPDERAQICTREYMPVCATRDTGVRCVTTPCPSSELKTYSNGCTACADEKVLGYIANACTEEPKAR